MSMTCTLSPHDRSEASAAPGSSLLRRMLEARERRAAAHMRQHLELLTDATLMRYGLSARQIASLRSTGRLDEAPACADRRAA